MFFNVFSERFRVRSVALIKVSVWRRIFVLSFHDNVGRYVTKVAIKKMVTTHPMRKVDW